MSKPSDGPAASLADGIMPLLTRIGRLGYAWLEPRLAEEGISLADFRLVGALLGEVEGLSQRELSARLEVRPPTISAAVDKLVAAGVVERLPSPTDARAYRVRLAKRAPGLAAAGEHVDALEARATRGLTPAERRELGRLLQHVLHNLVHEDLSPSSDLSRVKKGNRS